MHPARETPDEVLQAQARPAARFGKYVLLQEVGRGGMGRVYRAWDTNLGRIVALKVMLFNEPEDLLRFRQEAQLAAKLDHPGIVQVYEQGDADDRPYIAMQFVDGASLEVKRLPVRKAVEAVRDAARAIAYAHERGVIHRDLKPGNLLQSADGRLRVTDFGLAKRIGVRSLSGAALGTPSYMSPEQARGQASRVGPASDVFSLGATLYGLLAGRPPFLGADVMAVLRAVATDDPPSLRAINSKVPWELETVILKAMEKEPERRYDSAGALADDLERFLQGEAVHAQRPGFLTRARKRIAKRKGVLSVAMAGLLGIGGVSAYFLPRWLGEREEKERAQAEVVILKMLGTLWTEVVMAKQGLHVEASDPKKVVGRLRDLSVRVGDFIGAHPLLPQGYYVRAQARLYLGDLGAAEQDLQKAVSVDPSFAPAYVLLGRLKLEEHQWRVYGEPERKAANAEAASPLVEEAGRHLARGWKAGVEAASPERWGLVRTREDDVAIVLARALHEQYVKRNPAEALRILEEEQGREGAAEYCNRLGLLSPPDRNLEWQTLALRHMPHFAKAHLDRGAARFGKGDIDGAIADFDRAIQLRPDLASAWLNRGGAKYRKQDLAGAVADFDRAAALDPSRPLAAANRAVVRLLQGDAAGAEADATKAIELGPWRAESYATRGRARAARENLQGALEDYSKAVSIRPDDPDQLQMRGYLRILLVTRDPARAAEHRAEAVKDLERALKLAPADWPLRAQAEQALAELRKL
jgi:tetratricopeptide (TPR) repeat protein